MTKAGWLPFGDGVGNHRILFVDINSEIVLNKDKHEIIPIRARRLQLKKENSVKKYLELIEQQYCKHNLLQRLNGLRSKTGRYTTIDMIKEIKEIDKIRTSIVLKGERQCRKKRWKSSLLSLGRSMPWSINSILECSTEKEKTPSNINKTVEKDGKGS